MVRYLLLLKVLWKVLVMQYFYVIIVMCISLSKSQSLNSERPEYSTTSKGNGTSEQKVWNIKLDIYFSKPLPNLINKPIGGDMRLKCEAAMNFTRVEKTIKNKEGVETSQKELPPDHILQMLMKNVKMYWLKDSKIIGNTTRLKIFNRMDKKNGTLATNLRIRDLDDDDEANYTCVIRQSYEKKQTAMLKVIKDVGENYELPTYTSFLPSAEVNNQLEMSIRTTPDLLSQDIRSQHVNVTEAPNTTITRKLEPICQEYIGNVCSAHLKGQFVYIPYNTTQLAVEDKLMKALQVTKYSNDISSNCEGYALPSLCYSTFPICRDPFITNNNFFKEAKLAFAQPHTTAQDRDDMTPHIIFDILPTGLVPQFSKNITEQPFDYRYNSTVLKRVCKQDCEILENELCQKEYAIAKRHPHIGQQLNLEECQNLPDDDSDCLKIGIGDLMVSDDECYWENGKGYLGKVNTAANGMPCIEWSKQLRIKISEYPELTGLHSYCRNPGGSESQPWCIVDNEGKTEIQLCEIPKCALKIWIYIVVIFLLLTLTIVSFIICVCYKNKNKNNAAAIRDINLPNADKNIYGNSRLNSPIEMSELLTNQNITNQPHLTRNTRGNGILRIPQYSLTQIKFLEELGEGAFGKVYKGALKKNGETHYVAVKALKENASAKTQADFRREIDLISELTHDNIVCIVGVALSEEPLCMLFEFMARGDLHEFLMGRAPPSGKGLPPTRLLSIAHNIASGMQYLASHHYVHRDLAARNCLVSDDFVVKISDFGLSRDIYSSDYYRVQSKSLLPVRWMPPESILYGKFTTESDIWSYGVVLWEIYSYGLQPYYGYSNQEVIAMVRGGELLAAPGGCPALMYALMRDCWLHMPQRRPNFEQIVARFKIQNFISVSRPQEHFHMSFESTGVSQETAVKKKAQRNSTHRTHETRVTKNKQSLRIQSWIQTGGCPEGSESGSECGRGAGSERAPLLAGCSGSLLAGSSGSLAASSLRRPSAPGSSLDPAEGPPLAPKKKHSSGSLIDSDRATRETVVRIPNTQYGNEI